MILSGSAPFTLRENRVSYLIPGGEMIDAFYGHPVRENCMQSQAWIASTTYSALGGDNSGRSYLSPEYGDQTLKQVLDARGKEFLGGRPCCPLGKYARVPVEGKRQTSPQLA